MGAVAALTAVSSIGTLATSYSQSQALKSQGAYERQTADTNSRLANIQADDAIERGEREATELKKQTKRLVGSQRAALAAQGLDLESGDALAIQEETKALGALDALQIKNNAWREAWGYKVQANDYKGRGQFAYLSAKNQANNTILTGGMQVAKDVAYGAYLSKSRSTETTPRYKDVA